MKRNKIIEVIGKPEPLDAIITINRNRTWIEITDVLYQQIMKIKGVNERLVDVKFGWIRNKDGVVRLVTGVPSK